MGDFGDDFDMDDLIEEDAGFGAGDADEEDMMKMMEEENFTAAKASTQTTGATGATGAVPAASSPAAGADDDDLDWLAQAGATQTQGEGTVHRKNGDGDGDDASEDEDEALLFAGYKPPPLASNARANAPVRSALDIEGDAVAVTSADGRRAFVRAEPKGVSAPAFQSGFQSGGARGAPPSSAASSVKSFLLGESIDSMLDRIEARRRAEALAEAERLKRDAELGREGVRARDKAAEIGKKKRAAADAELCGGKTNGLWVDAHAPRHFTELLSAENVNREVLHWLKAWDGVVFNRAPPKPARDVRFSFGGRGRGGAEGGGRFGGGRGGGRGGGGDRAPARLDTHRVSSSHDTHVPLDADGRPAQKILLLSGPPGVGKTTLAHVAARHAGYRVVEVNASDDRGAEALKTRVTDATQMRSVLTAGGNAQRPNCVIIDEIDGVFAGAAEGRGAIHALLQIVNGARGPKSLAQTARERTHLGLDASSASELLSDAAEDGTMRVTNAPNARARAGGVRSGFRSNSKRGPGPLMRPIIAICNDPYAPALRPLREMAKVFKVAPPASARLNGRLREVCAKRGMRADTRALGHLAERSEGDVRACLNALQMLNQEGKSLTLADVESDSTSAETRGAASGEKDLTVQARALWRTLLSGHISNKRTRKASREAHQRHLGSMCQSFGDDALLLDGAFENVHGAKFQDASMAKSARALAALGDGDLFSSRARAKQQFFLSPHVIDSAMRVHACVNNAPSVTAFLEWPQGGKVRREATRRRALARSWAASARPNRGHSLAVASDATLACELAPFVLTAIAPDIRPVSAQFMKPHEAAALRATVRVMASLGLTYEPPAEASRGADAFRGAPASLALDPPIDELVMFGGGVPNVNAEPGTHRGARSFHGSFFSDGDRGSGGNARGGVFAHTKNADAPRADASLENRRFLPVGTKQMLAHEVRLETIRLAERSMHGPGTPPSAAEKPALRSVDENKDVAKRRLATAMGGLGPTASKKAKQRRVGGGVSYKHNEGFTNAVRRPVYLRDLV